MTKNMVVIDGNSVGFAAQNAKKLTSGELETTAIFGFLRSLHTILKEYPNHKPVVLWDGKTWRKKAFEEYKANRDALEKKDPKQADMRARYRKQRPLIGKILISLGVPQLIGAEHEADDLAGDYVRNKSKDDKLVLVSGDKDWLQLVGPNVRWFDPVRDRSCNEFTFNEFTGYETPYAFLQGKALQGDVGDNIPGVGGIGEKGAIRLLQAYKSVVTFIRMDEEQRNAKWPEYHGKKIPKACAEFASDKEKIARFARNMKLMDLIHEPAVPITDKRLINLPFNEEAFKASCADYAFHSILRDYDKWIAPFTR